MALVNKEAIIENLIRELYTLYSLKDIKKFLEFSQGEKRVLVELEESKKTLTPTDLVEKFGISKQRMTSIINSLKEKEYIDLKMDSKDRRRIIIILTNKGKKYIRRESEEIIGELNKTFSKMEDEELENFTKLVAKTNDIIIGNRDLND